MKVKRQHNKALKINNSSLSNSKKIKELKALIKEGQKNGDILLIGVAYYYISLIYYELEDRERMLVNSLKAVSLLDETKDYELMAMAHINLSYAYSEHENNQMSFTECDIALKIIRKHRIKGGNRIAALNNLATNYHLMKDLKSTIKIYKECLELTRKDTPEDYTSILLYIINLASAYEDNNEVDKAKAELESAVIFIDKVDFQGLVCDYYLRYALLEYKYLNVEKGKQYLDKALSIVPDDQFPHPLYEDLREIASILTKLKDWERAEKILKLMDIYAEQNKGSIEQLIYLRTYSDYYSNHGDYELANEKFIELNKLYEERLDELKGIEFNTYSRMKAVDSELDRLTKKMKENEKLVKLEPMTKLLNRSALLKVALEYIEIAKKKKQKVGALFIDIDFFKECNDTYGHARGDEIIKEVANACKKAEKDNIRFARYGGDEFFGIMHGMKDEDVIDVAKGIAKTIREAKIPNEKNPNGHILTLSIGIINISISEKRETLLDIISYADKAMYHAKNSGKNAIYILGSSDDNNDITFTKIDE